MYRAALLWMGIWEMRAVVARSLCSGTTRHRVVRTIDLRQQNAISQGLNIALLPRLAMRSFASTTGNGDSTTMEELLKRDFRRWLGKEAQLLAVMIVLGIGGVQLYQHRESAPAKQITTLLDKARENAQQEDRESALQNCLNAYRIAKSTNAQDRHLFEMAFLVAAQFESLRKVSQATKYYHEAFSSLPYIRDAAERDMSRVVVLDRIAQCYQDRGEQRAAENYYRQAIEAYDSHRGNRDSTTAIELQMDRDIAAVLFNYGQQLMHLKRWDESKQVLLRAQNAAKTASVSSTYRDRIDRLIAMVQQAAVDETQEEEGDNI